MWCVVILGPRLMKGSLFFQVGSPGGVGWILASSLKMSAGGLQTLQVHPGLYRNELHAMSRLVKHFLPPEMVE